MFDNMIKMGLLRKAYNLDIQECIALAQKSPCRFGTVQGFPVDDIGQIDEYAKRYARHIMQSMPIDKSLFIWANAMFEWRETDYNDAEKEWAGHYKAFMDVGDEEEALFRFWPVVRLYFVTDLDIEKTASVRLLHEQGYSLVQEVKGLSHIFVQKILAENNSIQPTEDAPLKQATSSSESPPPKIDTVTVKAWEEAIAQYEKAQTTRANDALPKRLRAYLAWRSGTPFSELEKDVSNLSRDLKAARTVDAPKLKSLYPSLPNFEGMTGE